MTPVTKQIWINGNRAELPMEEPGLKPIEWVLTVVWKTLWAVQIYEDHGRKHPNCCRLHVTKQVKYFFQIIETHSCGSYSKKHLIKSGPDADPNVKKKCGGQVSKIS